MGLLKLFSFSEAGTEKNQLMLVCSKVWCCFHQDVGLAIQTYSSLGRKVAGSIPGAGKQVFHQGILHQIRLFLTAYHDFQLHK